ncbi:hypothetical protein PFICI_07578 [Pestalotiopsis fici W106-1]|uniref:Uncharacterized protein n=1 Tax=Pestalotiopsis fici (strain W106-1 / CGMCC3.15140) TaxID=1229662 RepID=W3X207_PESFW|nr:uncharacterized protein PFICI_07578 [Pestalotiopsis fici W106-1]ETS80049.1 hypothetical protein PFICI_07578 [Pestalotiopsis fici W106-1]
MEYVDLGAEATRIFQVFTLLAQDSEQSKAVFHQAILDTLNSVKLAGGDKYSRIWVLYTIVTPAAKRAFGIESPAYNETKDVWYYLASNPSERFDVVAMIGTFGIPRPVQESFGILQTMTPPPAPQAHTPAASLSSTAWQAFADNLASAPREAPNPAYQIPLAPVIRAAPAPQAPPAPLTYPRPPDAWAAPTPVATPSSQARQAAPAPPAPPVPAAPGQAPPSQAASAPANQASQAPTAATQASQATPAAAICSSQASANPVLCLAPKPKSDSPCILAWFVSHTGRVQEYIYSLPPGCDYGLHIWPCVLRLQKILSITISGDGRQMRFRTYHNPPSRGLSPVSVALEAELALLRADDVYWMWIEECIRRNAISVVLARLMLQLLWQT